MMSALMVVLICMTLNSCSGDKLFIHSFASSSWRDIFKSGSIAAFGLITFVTVDISVLPS